MVGVSFHAGVQTDNVYFKALRAFPFFLIALYYGKAMLDAIRRYAGLLRPVALVIYTAAQFLLPGRDGTAYVLIAPFISIVSICLIFAICFRVEHTAPVRWMAAVGRSTLLIYLLHGIIIFYSYHLLEALSIARSDLFGLLITGVVAVLAIAIGRFVLKFLDPWTLAAPWLGQTNKRAQPA